MPRRKKADLNQILEWELDPFRKLKPEIEQLLVDIGHDYARLQKSGTALDYRVAVSKQAAVARQLLSVVRACQGMPNRGDIL